LVDFYFLKKISKYFFNELNTLKKDYPNIIKEIRGKGLLIGIQLHFDQSKFIKSLENKAIVDKLVFQGWYLPFNSDYLQSKYKTEILPISGPSETCWENSWSFPVLTNEQKINLKNIWNESLTP